MQNNVNTTCFWRHDAVRSAEKVIFWLYFVAISMYICHIIHLLTNNCNIRSLKDNCIFKHVQSQANVNDL